MSRPWPPTLFLPGLFEPALIWHPMIARLGRDARKALALDLPGHRPGDTELSVKRALRSGAWLGQVASRMRHAFDGRHVAIVGHSTGAMLGLALARRYPDLVHSVVLVGGLSSGHRDQGRDLPASLLSDRRIGRAAFRATWRLWLSTTGTFRRGFALGAPYPFELPQVAEMRARLLACDPMAVRACARWVLDASVTQDLPHIRAPILALIGRSDPVVPPAHQVRILQAAPNAQAQLLRGGHLLFAENPAQTERALRGWLSHARPAETTGATRQALRPGRSDQEERPFDAADPGSPPLPPAAAQDG